jgi:16S rRNA (cytosine1402-N4)-methyltransferase
MALAEVIKHAVGRGYERGRIHPATRTFLALRIYANDELVHLENILKSLTDILSPGGRVAIISFNSLEDRLIKNYFRDFKKKGELIVVTKKPVVPSDTEVRDNFRSRSAKLRVAYKT